MKKSILAACVLFLASFAHAQGPSFPYSVNLSWAASTSSGVTGYNVYRAPWTLPTGPCGTFANLTTTSLGPTIAAYVDSSATSGNAYCYETTAVGPTGESGPSNVVSNVQIPPAPPTGLTETTK